MRAVLVIVCALFFAAFILFAWADTRFQAGTDALIRRLLASVDTTPHAPVRAQDLAQLPAAVKRWLSESGVVGKPPVRSLRLRQRGELRSAPGAAFMQANAQQYFSIDPPAFVWRVRAPMWHVLPITGRDSFIDGHGHMQIMLGSLLTLADGKGDAIDQGTLLRFLGELVWFPSGALSPYLRWQDVDENHARVSMSYRQVTGTADLSFDASGRMLELRAQRYMGSGPDARLTPWIVRASAWRRFQGVQVPSQGTVGWQLPEGDFVYYRWEITSIDYDVPQLFNER